MKKLVLLTALIGTSLSAALYAATLTSLTKPQVTQMFSDQTITTVSLVTIDNQLMNNNSATIYFDKQGKVTGQFANKPETEPQTDTGTWMVKASGALCVTWQAWNSHNPICVNVYKTSNSVLFINEATRNFESMALNQDLKSGNQMSSGTTMNTSTTTQTTQPTNNNLNTDTDNSY